jgi:hypothetical protein
MKQENDRKDEAIKRYKAKKDRRYKPPIEENDDKKEEVEMKNVSDISLSNISECSPSTRRGIASKTISTSAATATATVSFANNHITQSRNRISLTSASPSTATSTLQTSLKRENNNGMVHMKY